MTSGSTKIFLLTYVLWLPLLGWCAFFARSHWQKLALLAATAVICPYAAYWGGNWTGAWVMNLLQIPVLAVLLWLPALRLPRHAIPAVMLVVSAASCHIYLFHRIIRRRWASTGWAPGASPPRWRWGCSPAWRRRIQRLAFTRLSRRASLAPSSA